MMRAAMSLRLVKLHATPDLVDRVYKLTLVSSFLVP